MKHTRDTGRSPVTSYGMDVVGHFDLNRRPFQLSREQPAYPSESLVAALRYLVDAAMAWTSPIVVRGAAGVGKSVLLGELRRQLGAEGKKTAIFASLAPASAADLSAVDVALIDEADAGAPAQLAGMIDAAADLGTVIVLAGIDPVLAAPPALIVTLAPMAVQDSYEFLLATAQTAGRPDLFRPAALDDIVGAAHGVPRIVKLLANAAMLEAMFDGSVFVEQRHAQSAIRDKAPLPPAPPPVERIAEFRSLAPEAVAGAGRARAPLELQAVEDARGAPDEEPPPAEDPAPLPIYFRPRTPEDIPFPPSERHAAYATGRERLLGRFADARGAIAGVGALVLVVAGAIAYGNAQLQLGDVRALFAALTPVPARPAAGPATLKPAARPDISASLAKAAREPLAVPDAPRAQPDPGLPADTKDLEMAAAEAAADLPTDPGPGARRPPSVVITPGYSPSPARFPSVAAAARAGVPLAPGSVQPRPEPSGSAAPDPSPDKGQRGGPDA